MGKKTLELIGKIVSKNGKVKLFGVPKLTQATRKEMLWNAFPKAIIGNFVTRFKSLYLTQPY